MKLVKEMSISRSLLKSSATKTTKATLTGRHLMEEVSMCYTLTDGALHIVETCNININITQTSQVTNIYYTDMYDTIVGKKIEREL